MDAVASLITYYYLLEYSRIYALIYSEVDCCVAYHEPLGSASESC